MKLGEDGAGRLLLIPFAPGIGDMVMMEPLLRAVVKRRPGWRITMPAKEYATDLFIPGGYELVSPSYFVTEPAAPLRPFHRLLPQRLVAWAAEPLMSLDLGPFETVVNLFWAWESRTPFNRWWTPQWPPIQGVVHAVDILASYLEEELSDEIPRDERVPRLQVFPEAAEWANAYLYDVARHASRIVALVPVASDSLKWWEARKWAILNDRLAADGWQPVLVAPRDHPHAKAVYEKCKMKPLWPEMSLRQLIALVARSDMAVGVDTGPLHAASALGVPWVGIFGPTNPDLIGPYDRTRGRALVSRFPKRPTCSDCWLAFKNKADGCPTLPATGCATLLGIDEVMTAVQDVVSGTLIAS